eukprot:2394970-Amphidinium_carterae.1
MQAFTHPTWWKVLVPDKDRVVSQNAKAFVLLSQQAALVEELLCTIHKQFPFPLFKTLVDDRASMDVAATPECCRGNFVNHLLSKHGLNDPKLREILLLHCQLCSTSIADLESKHASNRRTLVQHSVQTWAMQAATLSAEWYSRQLRMAHVKSALVVRGSTAPKQRQAQCQVGSEVVLMFPPPKVKKARPKKKVKRGGGAYRAFVHHQRYGKRGKECTSLKQCGVLWRGLKVNSSPMVATMTGIGRAATLARRVMKPGSGSAFGPSSRSVSRALRQASVQNLLSRTENMNMGAKADCLAQQTSFSGVGFAEAISECRRLMRLENSKRKERQTELQLTLQKWQSAELEKSLGSFLNLVPVLGADHHQLKPIPNAFGACAFDLTAAPAQCPTLAAGWASASQVTNLAKGLEKDWIGRHKSVQHVGAAPIVEATTKQSPCASGVCLNTAAGQQRQKLLKSVLTRLKACFNSKPSKNYLGRVQLFFVSTVEKQTLACAMNRRKTMLCGCMLLLCIGSLTGPPLVCWRELLGALLRMMRPHMSVWKCLGTKYTSTLAV